MVITSVASVTRFSASAAYPVPTRSHHSIPLFKNFVKLCTPDTVTVTLSKRFQVPSTTMSSTAAVHGEKITAPYGSWKSAISADFVSGSSKSLGGTAVDALSRLVWLESRPTEAGRDVLVREPEKPGEDPVDLIPKEFSVRTTVQEYGGGEFCISGNTAYFSNFKDQRLYKRDLDLKVAPEPLTPDYGGPVVSFADGIVDSRFNRYITVMEDFRLSRTNSTTTIASVNLCGKDIAEPKVLVRGNDFYAFPRLDPKGERLAWIEWGHPNMPWDRSELWVGYISETGEVCNRICVAGNDPALIESPTEPVWSSEGDLYFITDRNNGYWNLFKWIESTNHVEGIYPVNAEFSRPQWVFGNRSYIINQNKEGKNLIICSYRKNGMSRLGVLDLVKQSLSLLDIPFTDIENITSGKGCIYVEGASAVLPSSVAKVTLDDSLLRVVNFEIVWSSSPDCRNLTPHFSVPELIEFQTVIPGQTAYAYFYPPTNPCCQPIEDEKPPLLLKSHGGPTSESRGVLNLNIQYWTSRGWAVVDVNYGGSTGYGREFRERLLGKWGIVDINDCCSCAKFLVNNGKVDRERLCITGGSAGGFTTLAALAFTDTFRAGASLYGVADLSLLRMETHKFESHYLDNLVGPDEKDYFDRSPINFIDRFSCPLILFQGLEDKVVPPNQSREIYEAVKKKGLPVALVEYEGEQHGFRKAENIKFTLEQQMMFFARLIGHFDVSDQISPVHVDNFDENITTK